ncbi:Eukaryotic peptide chain release factor subunit 1-1 [Morella rubra]|uniref:Eukaryotic peptide chain release factor subunit 1-1 n=1 Tax=Morella rubra TaxID=262757 RepID=A0A6A1UHS8_9ROSI|nr:Eukaryotic peptide chain release factor subunit 1-1 [Morella rubra]
MARPVASKVTGSHSGSGKTAPVIPGAAFAMSSGQVSDVISQRLLEVFHILGTKLLVTEKRSLWDYVDEYWQGMTKVHIMYNRSTLVVPLLNRMMDFVIEVVTLSKTSGCNVRVHALNEIKYEYLLELITDVEKSESWPSRIRENPKIVVSVERKEAEHLAAIVESRDCEINKNLKIIDEFSGFKKRIGNQLIFCVYYNISRWQMKLIKALEAARGNGTGMISLIMPPLDQISRVTKMLGDEFGTASKIKSRVNRQSVLGAITSARQRLKLYNKVPPNGLVLYTGTIVTDDGKEKKVTIDFEPFRPINASLHLCDNKFHTEALNELLESDDKFGFIVMDGNGTLFGTLSGNTIEVLHKYSVDLPKKHGRGGKSALRFARLRMEKRQNYVRKTAELAIQFYINPSTSQPNVSGLILAGSADFKTELSQSDMFDPKRGLSSAEVLVGLGEYFATSLI